MLHGPNLGVTASSLMVAAVIAPMTHEQAQAIITIRHGRTLLSADPDARTLALIRVVGAYDARLDRWQ
jgi:hypothetical protein